MKYARLILAAIVAPALGIGVLVAHGRTPAEDQSEIKVTVQKVADAIEKGDIPEAKSLAEKIAKIADLDMEDVMGLMAIRRKGQKKVPFGVGKEAGALSPDGIEAKIQNISKKAMPQKDLDKQSNALMEMAYRIAAIAEVAKAKVPEKDEGAKKKADWIQWSGELRDRADELAKAAKRKNPGDVKEAANKINMVCTNCHEKFK